MDGKGKRGERKLSSKMVNILASKMAYNSTSPKQPHVVLSVPFSCICMIEYLFVCIPSNAIRYRDLKKKIKNEVFVWIPE